MTEAFTYKQYKRMVEEQVQAMLDVLAFAATGNLDVEIEIPEGIDVLTDLAIGLSYLLDDMRELLAEQAKAQAELERRVAERTSELEQAVADLRLAQQRYVRQEWQQYAEEDLSVVTLPGTVEAEADLEWTPVLSQAIETQQPVVRANGHQALALPIHYSDEIIGVFGFAKEDERGWDEQDVAAVTTVMEQLGLALENQRLFDQTQAALKETQKRNEELALINRVVSAVTASLDLQANLQIIADELVASLSLGHVGIALLNNDRASMTLVADAPEPKDGRGFVGITFPLEGNTVTQEVITTKRPVILPNVQHDPRMAMLRNELRQRGTETLIIYPLNAGNEVIGTVGVDIVEKERQLTPEEMRLVETVVLQAGTAIQNARLFEQTERALTETASLYQSSADLNAAQTYDDILAVLRRHTTIGQRAQAVHLAYFDRPWTEGQQPEWIDILAQWFQEPSEEGLSRYRLADFPALRLLRTGTPIVIEDSQQDSRLDNRSRALLFEKSHTHSAVFAPLIVGGQWLGYIGIFYGQLTTFAEAEIRRLMGLAGQAAVTLQSIRLLEETNQLLESEQHQRRIADTLARAAGRMTETLDESELRQIVIDEIFDILRPDQINLYAWVEGERVFRLEQRRLAGLESEDRYVLGELLTPDQRPDLWQAYWHNRSSLKTLHQDGLLREHYCLPWHVGTRPAGIIEIFHTAQRLTIRPEDQRRCEIIVQQAAIAIQNARLYEAEQVRARREQLLREITTRVRSSTDVDTIMRTAVQEVGRILGRRAMIYIGDDPKAASVQE